MKDYRSQFDALRFSPEEKQAMIDDLLATAPETHRRGSHKKRVHILIAAVIAPSAPPAHPGRCRPRSSPSAFSWGISRSRPRSWVKWPSPSGPA